MVSTAGISLRLPDGVGSRWEVPSSWLTGKGCLVSIVAVLAPLPFRGSGPMCVHWLVWGLEVEAGKLRTVGSWASVGSGVAFILSFPLSLPYSLADRTLLLRISMILG